MNSKQTIHLLSLGVVGLLSACGGGHDDGGDMPVPPTAASQVPDSAMASSAAYTQFAISQSQRSSESEEPLNAGNVDPAPGSESEEPVAVS
ncbi:hypothetical protein [Roseateles violae]|uniref:Lipoprotein n=1 Tax=Roseateles violae TaxID=3058042 RepID=A0ABT8DV32_9BURK|nr:hypothetical protein [Pelomonas sp. PFR6]MDN3922137.1 hypothetical protein [Pelomonas sp. PFR6]